MDFSSYVLLFKKTNSYIALGQNKENIHVKYSQDIQKIIKKNWNEQINIEAWGNETVSDISAVCGFTSASSHSTKTKMLGLLMILN